LVAYRFNELNEDLREKLRQMPATSKQASLRSGGSIALEMLKSMLLKGEDGELYSFVWTDSLSNEMVDTLLSFGQASMRSHLSMNSKFMYTPAHIERMLLDTNSDVVVGVLRRKEIKITREQFDRGINSAEPNIAFWYGQRNEFEPSTDQYESALTSPDAPTRRGAAFDLRFTPTAEQTKRALKDPAIRNIFIGRKDVTLTDADFDACTISQDVGERFACVRRSDYPLTQQRFNIVFSDWNQNVPRFFLQRTGVPQPDLSPYIRNALETGSEKLQLTIAQMNELNLDDGLLKLGSQSKNTAVRAAFCRRQINLCGQ
jgi:hypothetical protein